MFEDAQAVKAWSVSPLPRPVLALGGERGAGAYMLPAWQRLATRVEGGIVAGAGHWIADEQPQAPARRLDEFFGRTT